MCILDRPRHRKIINELIKSKSKTKTYNRWRRIYALLVTKNEYNVDLFLGIGGGPEGVLAASALDAYNCFFQGRFIFDNEKDKLRAKEMGIDDLKKNMT